ncbi:MAG TPA: hypothetical protein PLI95_28005 [Polyangiaceae bacterium]|nr:hypothetical protein [Polyangiaceae bacterium]
MTRLLTVLALGLTVASQGCCSSKSAESGNTVHSLPECGIELELPNHFGKPTHTKGCAYDWTANESMTLLGVTGALPGDTGKETEASTAMPGQVVDYARPATFGALPGKERRTQQKMGAQNRAVWTGFFTGPKGGVNLKVTAVQKYTADEFGEAFWKNLRTRWVRPAKSTP